MKLEVSQSLLQHIHTCFRVWTMDCYNAHKPYTTVTDKWLRRCGHWSMWHLIPLYEKIWPCIWSNVNPIYWDCKKTGNIQKKTLKDILWSVGGKMCLLVWLIHTFLVTLEINVFKFVYGYCMRCFPEAFFFLFLQQTTPARLPQPRECVPLWIIGIVSPCEIRLNA